MEYIDLQALDTKTRYRVGIHSGIFWIRGDIVNTFLYDLPEGRVIRYSGGVDDSHRGNNREDDVLDLHFEKSD